MKPISAGRFKDVTNEQAYMTDVIGDWPNSWRILEVGDDPNVNESESDGNNGVRVIPDHLADIDDVGNGNAAAVLVQHIQQQIGPGEEREYWNLAIQSQHSIAGEDGRGYINRWVASELTEHEAQNKIHDIIDDLQDVDQLRDVPYLTF